MRPSNPPPPSYAFKFRSPPVSGNTTNGLGDPRRRRATQVFHNATGRALPWDALDDFFSYINPWGVVRHMLANSWVLRNRDGAVAATRRDVTDPVACAGAIKGQARRLGADLVGITPVTEAALYEGREAPFPTAICLGLAMDREEMVHVPQARAAVEVMRSYRRISETAVRLSAAIRAMGWGARAYGNPNSTDILHIPLAVAAGLGQLGKHGSMISREHGSNFRLATVLTELPLAPDEPVDIGVEDLCARCRRCVLDCPPNAIFEDKQLVRGEKKWYVDFDSCVPYFVKTFGCAICIEVCPWSEPGRGPKLTELMLARRIRPDEQTETNPSEAS